MGVADAHAMHPAIDVVEADPDADLRLLEELADWCDRYTPLVALDGTQGLFLDITGCATLFGGERAMLEAMLPRFLRQGFYARAGIASTAGAAWAAARFGSDGPVVPGAEADLLAPMPLAALRVEAGIRTRLESVGLRTVGALMAVPRAPLARRFGAELLVRLDQALGHLAEAVSPRLPAAPLSVERQLVEPLVATDDVEELAYMLATSLKPDLERRSEGARALMLALFRVDGTVRRITVATSRPLRDPASIRRLFREKLAATAQGLDAGCGFDLLRLSVISVAPFDIRQTGFDEAEGGQDDDLALFVDRVRARLGERAVLKAVAVESHLPERAVALLPFSQTAPHGPAPARRREVLALPERPIRLLRRPEPIEVPATEMPEGPPLRFHWRRIIHHVAHAEGPERIAPEWWRCEEEGAEAPTRDYYRVEDIEGRRYWLYRQGLHKAGETPPRWFMHGLFP